MTLSGASRIVLRATSDIRAFLLPPETTVTVNGVQCNVSAVSEDGVWAVVDTPSTAQLGSSCSQQQDGDCGYVMFSVSNAPSVSTTDGRLWAGASLSCPPFCPGAIGGGVVPVATAEGIARGIALKDSVGLPALLPPQSEVTSQGFYYAAACSKTGLYTDPAFGACSNESDPESFLCAYGSGDACTLCPSASLCPGGSRECLISTRRDCGYVRFPFT